MSDPWQRVKAGNASDPRTAKHLAAQAQYNSQVRGTASAAGGLIDQCGPPYWDEHAWNSFKAVTGREPFSASELPPSLEDCPAWAFERMGLRPPLMAR